VYAVGAAPSAERDIDRILQDLHSRARVGKVPSGFADRFLDEVHEALEGLADFPERHPYAPERRVWRRDVRNVLLATGYRMLFQVHDDVVWVMRVRHQRQRQLGSSGPGSAYRPGLFDR
jgi:plasmid stabilization system protein ParE